MPNLTALLIGTGPVPASGTVVLGLAGAASVLLIVCVILALRCRRQRRRLASHEDQVDCIFGLARGFVLLRLRRTADGAIRIDRISPAITELLGRPAEAYVQDPQSLFDQILVEDRQRVLADLAAGLSAGLRIESRFRAVHCLESAPRTCHLVAQPHAVASGQACLALVLDLTSEAKAKADHDLLQEKVQVALRHESLGFLASGIAHDFNNLLAAIRGNAELLSSLVADVPTGARRLQRVLDGVDRASGLVRQILAYAGKCAVVARPLDLAKESNELRALLRHGLPKGVTLAIQAEPGLPRISFDPAQFQQILVNLVVNAAESYNGSPGVVAVSLARNGADRIRIVVRDQGCGMDETAKTSLFRPYFTTKANGHGLGLAAVHSIIRQNGGTITCASQPGQGTVFTIDLLIGIVDPTPPPTSGRVGAGRGRRAQLILLVSADAGLRTDLAALLIELGHLSQAAVDGGVALEVLAANRFNAVVLDHRLAGCLDTLRAEHPDLPVILIGANGNRSPEAGADKAAAPREPTLCRRLAHPCTQMQLSFALRELAVGLPGSDSDSTSSAKVLASVMRNQVVPGGSPPLPAADRAESECG